MNFTNICCKIILTRQALAFRSAKLPLLRPWLHRKVVTVMSHNQDNFRRGTAEMLVLYLLQQEDLYGYQITQKFAQKSNGVYTMLEGSLYPILYRLSVGGYISDYIKPAGLRRTRRYYHIEKKGVEHFKQMLSDYESVSDAIDKILDRKGGQPNG